MTVKKFFTGAALLLGAFAGITTIVSRLPIVHAATAGGGFIMNVTLPPGTQPDADHDNDGSLPASIDFGTLATSDGGLIGNVAPLECLHGKSSIGLLVGSWRFTGTSFHFQMRGPIYDHRGKTLSMISIVGTSSGISGNVSGNATFSGLTEKTGCESLDGITASWTGQPILQSKPD